MIGVVFSRGGDEMVEVRVNNNDITWRSTVYGASFFPLDTLDLDKNKVIKEFPDLEENKDWRDTAMKRLKEKLKSFDNENRKIEYIVGELKKVGYNPHSFQKQGGRVQRWVSWTG